MGDTAIRMENIKPARRGGRGRGNKRGRGRGRGGGQGYGRFGKRSYDEANGNEFYAYEKRSRYF